MGALLGDDVIRVDAGELAFKPDFDPGQMGELGARYGLEFDPDSVARLCTEYGLNHPLHRR